jgi:gluconolactonase
LATGLGWPEGPALLADGSVCFVETYLSRVSRWSSTGVSSYAHTAGGPNACVVADDGSLVVCQNGGTTGPWRADVQVTPGLQVVAPDQGAVREWVTEVDGLPLNGPNDLVYGPDGTLYFTDPGEYRPEDPQPSRIFSLGSDGAGSLLVELDPPTFPNGIAVDAGGNLYWAESYTGLVKTLPAGGQVTTLAELPGERPVADGMAIAENGDLWVTTVNGGGIDVLAPDGHHRGHLRCGRVPTNCLFAGDGMMILTDAGLTATGRQAASRGELWLLDVGTDGIGTWQGPAPRLRFTR